jgi:hypothetical protein
MSGPLNVGGLPGTIRVDVIGGRSPVKYVDATLAETARLNHEHPASAIAIDPQVAASSLHFPSNISDGQPYIKFTVEEFQGPKFAPNTRQPIGSGMPTRASVLTAGASGASGPSLAASSQASAAAVASNLRFGDTINIDGQTWDVLNADGVIAPSSASSATAGTSSFKVKESITETKSIIKLFLPHQLNEQYGLSWSQAETGLPGQAYETGVWETFDDIYESGGAWQEFLGRFLGRATGSAAMKDVPLRHDKAQAVNPHMESFFKGVQFRKFTYNFQMFPKTSIESNNIKEIIKAFKLGAAPSSVRGTYGRWWKYPKQFNIQYSNENRTHKLKRCFLESIAVNYGAAGVNQRFKTTGAPLQTDLTLNFTELDLVQMEDIKDGY